MKTCQHCNRPNRDVAQFCKWCGEEMPVQQVAQTESQVESQTQPHVPPQESAPVKSRILPQIVGMQDVKAQLEEFVEKVKIIRKFQSFGSSEMTNILITGNSGTGKTCLAESIDKYFLQEGITTKPMVKIVDAGELATFCDPKKWAESIELVKGGMLFIDKAQNYMGADNCVAHLQNIIDNLEEWGGNVIVILAGLTTEVCGFMESHPTARNRFALHLHLKDYALDELRDIALSILRKEGISLSPDAVTKLEGVIKNKKRDTEERMQNANISKKLAIDMAVSLRMRDKRGSVVMPDDIKHKPYVRRTKDEVLATLDDFVGIDEIRKAVVQMIDSLDFEAQRNPNGKRAVKDHYRFLGNPGTGKTTIARVFADILSAIDVLPIGQLVEVSRKDLVGRYSGHTAPLVESVFQKAMGGVLFIDEAYSLKQGDNDTFGQEAIDTLLKLMEDNRGKIVCIIAGYSKEMDDFIKTNSGLDSRFNELINFRDYTGSELAEIFRRLAKANKMILSPATLAMLDEFFQGIYNRRTPQFGNARDVRNIFEDTLKQQSQRLRKLRLSGATEDREEIYTIEPQDIAGDDFGKELSLDECLAHLDGLVGLNKIKKEVRDLAQRINMRMKRSALHGNLSEVSLDHYVFCGNPGTGKTTVARIMAQVFYSLKLLPTANLVEVGRTDLVGQFVGQTAPKTTSVVQRALGGILFIDEAYTLAKGGQNDFGQEAIDTLLKLLLDYKGKFICIVAGYSKEMDDFIHSNSGLPSRFEKKIEFEDYGPDDLYEIFKRKLAKEQYQMTPEAEVRAREVLTLKYNQRDQNFGNAREVGNYFERVMTRQANRLSELAKVQNVDITDYDIITESDVTE